jgi:chromate transporter
MGSTVGIFLPGFVFVGVSGLLLPKLRWSPPAVAMLDGVVVRSLALMAVVAWQLGRAAIVDWRAFVILLCVLLSSCDTESTQRG